MPLSKKTLILTDGRNVYLKKERKKNAGNIFVS